MGSIHGPDAALGRLPEQVTRFITERLGHTPVGRVATTQTMASLLDGAITEDGAGADAAWELFAEAVVPNTVGLGSERFLAFIPVSPSAAGVWMDAAVSAANFSAESWLEASGAVAAENQVLRLLADGAGLPLGAGGCFMSGGSIGNLSALAVAREHAGSRRTVAVADTAHSSLHSSLRLLAMETMVVPTGADGRFTGAALAEARRERPDVGVVGASGGSTNGGVVDDLSGLAEVCSAGDLWLHVDAAYGGAALLVPELAPLFGGIERADSIIIDPHKWLFGPAGSCALLYREPARAAAVHTQHGPYLDILRADAAERWNPSDYGFQLTRRASGLPLWLALVAHGLESHREAIRVGVDLAARCAECFAALPEVDLVLRPQLGVVLFRRSGWAQAQWRRWAERLLAEQVAFVAPSTWRGEPVGRLVFMHPKTPPSLIDELAATLTDAFVH